MVQLGIPCLVCASFFAYRNKSSVFQSSNNLERSSLTRSLKAVYNLFIGAEFVDGTRVLISAWVFIL